MITHAGTDDHAACIHLIQTAVVLREQLELRADDSAKIRQTDKTAVQMSGKSKVRTPGSIFFKKDRIISRKVWKRFYFRIEMMLSTKRCHKTTPVQAHHGFRLLTLASNIF
jgi:hypothetical protein